MLITWSSLTLATLTITAAHALPQGDISASLGKTSRQWRVQAYDSNPAGNTCTGKLILDTNGSTSSGCLQPTSAVQCYIAVTADGSTCSLIAYRGDFNSGSGDAQCSSAETSVTFKFGGVSKVHATSYGAKSFAVVC